MTFAARSLGASAIFRGVLNTIFLTSGTSWTVPSDWQSTTNGALGWANKIECVGAGQGGFEGGSPQSGGTGGDYSGSTNVALTPGGTATYAIGLSGGQNGGAGGDSWFNGTLATNATVTAKGGGSGTLDRGAVSFAGGVPNNGSVRRGGGSAAGPDGAGQPNNAGTPQTGGIGDNGLDGAGGVANTNGGNGTYWDASHGLGGGGGGASTSLATAGNGGNYGAGGGAGASLLSGTGGLAICVVRYYS